MCHLASLLLDPPMLPWLGTKGSNVACICFTHPNGSSQLDADSVHISVELPDISVELAFNFLVSISCERRCRIDAHSDSFNYPMRKSTVDLALALSLHS